MSIFKKRSSTKANKAAASAFRKDASPARALQRKKLVSENVSRAAQARPITTTRKARNIDIGLLGHPEGRKMWLTPKERSMHMHVLGPTGAGKTKFLEWCIREDIKAGNGVMLLDPTGDLYYDLVAWLQKTQRWNRREVVLIDPSVPGQSFGFNPLKFDQANNGSSYFSAECFVKAVTRVFDDGDTTGTMAKTPQLKKHLTDLSIVLSQANLTLMEYDLVLGRDVPAEVRDFLLKDVSKIVRDEIIRLTELHYREYHTEVGSTLNRLHPFLVSDVTQGIFGQHDKSIDFRDLMDRQAIVLVNLGAGEGRCPPQDMNMLGTLLINELFVQSVQRPKNLRTPFYLYVDECHQYLTPDVERLLVECRKYGLHAVLAHQHLGQLRNAGELIYDGVMNNARNKVVFGGLGMENSRDIANELFAHEIVKDVANPLLKNYATVGFEKIILHNQSHTDNVSSTEGEVYTSGSGTSAFEAVHGGGFFSDIEDTYSSGDNTSSNEGYSTVSSTTSGHSDTKGESEALKPIIKELVGATLTMEEKVGKAAAKLHGLGDRQAAIKSIYNDVDAQLLYVPDVKTVTTTLKRTKEVVEEQMKRMPHLYSETDAVVALTKKRRDSIYQEAGVKAVNLQEESQSSWASDFIQENKDDS